MKFYLISCKRFHIHIHYLSELTKHKQVMSSYIQVANRLVLSDLRQTLSLLKQNYSMHSNLVTPCKQASLINWYKHPPTGIHLDAGTSFTNSYPDSLTYNSHSRAVYTSFLNVPNIVQLNTHIQFTARTLFGHTFPQLALYPLLDVSYTKLPLWFRTAFDLQSTVGKQHTQTVG